MGISDGELESLEERCTPIQWEQLRAGIGRSRPTRDTVVAPFLLASAPLTGRALEILGLCLEDGKVSRLYSGPQRVTYVDPSEIGALLRSATFRLPSEAEWEHACRAGSTTPFFWGSELPVQPNSHRNALGLSELGNHPEACEGPWRDSPASSMPSAIANWWPVRGGAAAVYPWQDCGEWLLMLSGWRWAVDPEGDRLDRQVCLRLCVDLPTRMAEVEVASRSDQGRRG